MKTSNTSLFCRIGYDKNYHFWFNPMLELYYDFDENSCFEFTEEMQEQGYTLPQVISEHDSCEKIYNKEYG